MKEFIEQLKLYKEYVLTVVALVGGCLFVINYFATKEALTNTQTALNKLVDERQSALNRLIDERECWLNNRITVSEVSAAIANLEKERLERTRMKIDLAAKSPDRLSLAERMYAKEQLDQLARDFQRIDEELKAYRVTAKFASENLMNGSCSKLKESKK